MCNARGQTNSRHARRWWMRCPCMCWAWVFSLRYEPVYTRYKQFVFIRSINPSVQASQIAFYSSSGNWNEHMWGKQPGDHSLINPAGKRSDMLLVWVYLMFYSVYIKVAHRTVGSSCTAFNRHSHHSPGRQHPHIQLPHTSGTPLHTSWFTPQPQRGRYQSTPSQSLKKSHSHTHRGVIWTRFWPCVCTVLPTSGCQCGQVAAVE